MYTLFVNVNEPDWHVIDVERVDNLVALVKAYLEAGYTELTIEKRQA